MRTITTSQSLDMLTAKIDSYALAHESMAMESDNFFKNAIEKIKQFLKTVWEWLKSVGKAVILWFKRLWHNIKQLAKVAWNKIKFIGDKYALVPYEKLEARMKFWEAVGKELSEGLTKPFAGEANMAPAEARARSLDAIEAMRTAFNNVGMKTVGVSLDDSGRFLADALLKEKSSKNKSWADGATWKKIDTLTDRQVKISDVVFENFAKALEQAKKAIESVKENEEGDTKRDKLSDIRVGIAALRKMRTCVNSYKSVSAKDFKLVESIGKKIASLGKELPKSMKETGTPGEERLTARRKSFLERDMDRMFI